MVLPWLGAALGGVVGAGVWAAVAYFLNLELGWIAWAIGGLVGFGARLLAPQQLSFASGAGAAVIAVAAIVGGKYLTVDLLVGREFGKVESEVATMSDEMPTTALAQAVVEEYEQAGQHVRWPEGHEAEEIEGAESYPADVWTEAESRYAALSPAEQAEMKEAMRKEFLASMALYRDQAKSEGFRESFSGLDLLFVALAVGTAFKIASGAPGAEA